MLRNLAFCLTGLLPLLGVAQQTILTGTITDRSTGETLITAYVVWAEGKGAAVDFDGNYSVELPFGEYTITASSVGYEPVSHKVLLNQPYQRLDFQLSTISMKEVVITSDIALGRETPVAFSNIPLKRFQEELASRDLASIVNTTPGAYATQQGGGDGDARVTIRGFNQNNVAVMLDGVPVNDMENGAVFWSNWFGLDVVMQTTQIQRGLGASKIAIPAVGGTINILTRGIEQKRRVQVKQEVGDNGFIRTSLGLSTGRSEKGWGFTFAGSYKRGDGWVDGTWTKGYFWYGKIEKAIGRHVIGLSAFGAPQKHGQRANRESIAVFSNSYAKEQGVWQADMIPAFGPAYNMHVGTLTRYDVVNGDRTNEKTETLNERVNYYHKPQFSLKDIWNISEKSFLSTVAYMSIGNGGGTQLDQNPTINNGINPDGSVDFQKMYDTNSGQIIPLFSGPDYNIRPEISPSERYSFNYIKSSINNHFWYGLLSTLNHKFNDAYTLSGGVDLRRYRGEHYREVYDLLGGDYVQKTDALNQNDPNTVKKVGDKIEYHNDSYVQWGGLFSQLEYTGDRWSGFISGSFARTGYRRIDYFLPRVIEDGDKKIPVGYHIDPQNQFNPNLLPDSVIYNGKLYTPDSPELKYQETDWIWKNGFTAKAGANYNINEALNAFTNVGYLSKAPLFNQVFDFSNRTFQKILNENIIGLEAGFGVKKPRVASTINIYHTTWRNRPFPGGVSVPDPQDPTNTLRVNIAGINARHMGVEWEIAYKVTSKLTVEALASFGDWIWTSKDSVRLVYDNGLPVLQNGNPVYVSYDARGVHVGNAAQSQLGAMLRYEFLEGAYMKMRFMWFDRQFADFDPMSLNGDNAGRESWKAPSYGLVELHGGYSRKLAKLIFDIRGSVLNALNTFYISDARNNDQFALYVRDPSPGYPGFDASSAGVFVGQGRRFNISLTITY